MISKPPLSLPDLRNGPDVKVNPFYKDFPKITVVFELKLTEEKLREVLKIYTLYEIEDSVRKIGLEEAILLAASPFSPIHNPNARLDDQSLEVIRFFCLKVRESQTLKSIF